MYYVQAAPFVCFIITALPHCAEMVSMSGRLSRKENKLLEEGSILVIEKVVEDTFHEKEPGGYYNS